jgi:4-amino-4-deoxy-L-arabinose transferase-like glycosyltransferase
MPEDRSVQGRELRLSATAILVVLAVALTLNLSRLGAGSLLGDEAIYANAAREAAVHGHWYPPMTRGEVFINKPPLTVWAPALSFSLLGVSEEADRLPSALAGVAEAALVCAFAAWLFDPATGALAGLLLATCRPWLFGHGVREGVSDPLLTLLMTAALLLYLRYRSTGRPSWLAAAGAAAALSSLLKNALGPLLLLAVTVAWEIAVWALPPVGPETGGEPIAPTGGPGPGLRGARLVSALRHPAVLALAGLSPLCVWFADNLVRVPGFLASQQRETLTRVLQGLDPSHLRGPAYFLTVLGEAFGHWWVGVVPAALALARLWRRGGPRARAALLLPIWGGVVVGGLTLSVSKLSWYIDPALPAVSVLLAAGFGEVGRRLALSPALRLVFGLAVLGLAGARGAYAWRTLAARPAGLNPMHRLVLAVRGHQGARFYLDDMSADVVRIREWNYFYMNLLDDVSRPLPAALEPARCTFVVTTHAARLLARRDFAGADLVVADRHSAAEADLSIVDLCGGALAHEAHQPQTWPGW